MLRVKITEINTRCLTMIRVKITEASTRCLTDDVLAAFLQLGLDHLLCAHAAGLCGEVDEDGNVVLALGDVLQRGAGNHRLQAQHT